MEEPVIIPGAGITLEGRFQAGRGAGGVVLTHPHPLYGGSLDNNVVWTAALAFEARGWATLRFNFRGVGLSTGTYGDGLAEVADLAEALKFLKTRTPGPYQMVGYSFGAFVAARAMLQGVEADGVLLISPPIAFMDLSFLPRVPRLYLIVVGDRDGLCPLRDLQKLLAPAKPAPGPSTTAGRQAKAPELAVIAGADHFFGGREDQLFKVLRDSPLPPGAE